jgi:hypothetical protein
VVDELALETGAVLFRGFGVSGAEAFRVVMDALSDRVLGLRRALLTAQPGARGRVHLHRAPGRPAHPAAQRAVLHAGLAAADRLLLRAPAERGGRTPLADSRRVLAALRPETVERFERLGVQYVRNYIPGISLSWQEAFQTDDPADVRAHCARAGIELDWPARASCAPARCGRACTATPSAASGPGSTTRCSSTSRRCPRR